MATSVPARDIELVRGFNRLVTRRLGALDDPYLGKRPLGECRVLYEIGLDGATTRDVRARLGLDVGYLARLVRALERDGLVRESEGPAGPEGAAGPHAPADAQGAARVTMTPKMNTVRRIVSNPDVLGGKPIVRGTRISVEQVLGMIADGMSEDAICRSYPPARTRGCARVRGVRHRRDPGRGALSACLRRRDSTAGGRSKNQETCTGMPYTGNFPHPPPSP